MSRVLVICVNYHNEDQTSDFVRQLLDRHPACDCHVLVASNDVRPGIRTVLDQLYAANPQVTLINSEKNLGYFGAAYDAFVAYRKTHEMPDWVVVSNTDLIIDTSIYKDGLERHDPDGQIGVVAPAISSTVTLVDQNPFMAQRPPALRMHVVKWAFRTKLTWALYTRVARIKQRVHGRIKTRAQSTDTPASNDLRTIYAPHGSFVIFSRAYFNRGGTLKHVPFLYGEEVTVAENASRLGLRVLYDPAIRIRHIEHSTTGKSKTTRLYQAASAAYCANTYFPLLKKGSGAAARQV